MKCVIDANVTGIRLKQGQKSQYAQISTLDELPDGGSMEGPVLRGAPELVDLIKPMLDGPCTTVPVVARIGQGTVRDSETGDYRRTPFQVGIWIEGLAE